MTRPQPSLYATAARLWRAAERARRLHRPVRVTLRLSPEAAALMARVLAHAGYTMERNPS